SSLTRQSTTAQMPLGNVTSAGDVEPPGVAVFAGVAVALVGVPPGAAAAKTCTGKFACKTGALPHEPCGITAVIWMLVFDDVFGAVKFTVNVPSEATWAVPTLVAQPLEPCGP